MRRAISMATTTATVVALLALAAATWWAIDAMDRANARVTESRAIVERYVDLREGLAEQAFAEAGYRRAPDAQAWARLERAMAAVPELAGRAAGGIGRQDRATLSQLRILNARYVAQIRATRDAPSVDGDDRVAGPALDAMNELSAALVDRHRAAVADATQDQARLIGTMRVILPVTFAISFSILGWGWRLGGQERRRLHAQAAGDRARALTDPLTGLSNRAALFETLPQMIVRGRGSAALLMLDLDRFKSVNDTWGHPAGDAVLRQVAERLRGVVRTEDLTVRLGGDEFAVLLANAADAPRVAHRILASFVEPFDADGHPVVLGTSIGIAESAHHADATALVRAADDALYRVKRTGRGRVEIVDPTLDLLPRRSPCPSRRLDHPPGGRSA